MNKREKPLVIPVFIPHFGCPHQCAFCNQTIITNQGITNQGITNQGITNQGITGQGVLNQNIAIPDQDDINQTIDQYLQFKGGRSRVELAFFGGNFLGLDPAKIIGLLEIIIPYIQEKKIDGIRFSTRPDTINSDTLSLIDPFPITAVELGVQSMNDKVLKQSNRGHTCQDTISAMELLKEKGYSIGVQVMVGLPGDIDSSLMESTRMIAGFEPDFARIYPLLVLKGSQLETWFQQGKYAPLSLEDSVDLSAKMIRIFQGHKVKVVRVGLQASDMMEDESMVVAGPWHPAFGHLVFSQIMFENACQSMDEYLLQIQPVPNLQKFVCVHVHPQSASRLRGDKNNNFEKLKHRYPDWTFSIREDEKVDLDQVQFSMPAR